MGRIEIAERHTRYIGEILDSMKNITGSMLAGAGCKPQQKVLSINAVTGRIEEILSLVSRESCILILFYL